MTRPDLLLAGLIALAGLAGLVGLWLLARRARRAGQHSGNRPRWDSPVVDVRPYRAVIDGAVAELAAAAAIPAHVLELSTPADPTVVPSWAERAARAAAMGRHPSTFRPTRSAYEALAASIDEALATVTIPAVEWRDPQPRTLDALDDAPTRLLPALPPVPSPVITNTDAAELEDGRG